MSVDQNKIIYSNKESAEYYNKDKYLLAPERMLLKDISNCNMQSMLDIGVGAGRTTYHFANLFESYTAIDYSDSMVEMCKKNFESLGYSFYQQDARDLKIFKDESFDFVLFSFNGIDCVNINDRELVLKEVFRVLKKNGLFFFSVHNMLSIPLLYSLQLPKNPFKWIKEFDRVKKVNLINPKYTELTSVNAVEIVDGDIDFQAKYVYIRPLAQKNDLEQIGFTNIRLYDLNSGIVIENEANYSTMKDSWVYFSCIK